MVEPGEGLDEDVGALVAELVAAGGEHVERLVQLEVEVAVEVAAHELVDLLLARRVQVLIAVWVQKAFTAKIVH